MRRIRTALVVLAVAAVAVSACSTKNYAAEVDVEARWQCDVQRHTFADLNDLNDALARRLDAAGLTADEYEAFKDELTRSTSLRAQVDARYESYCPAAAPPTSG